MAQRDLRTWISLLEAAGELRHVAASVDWDDEIAEITKRVAKAEGPALVFDNVRGHERTFCRRLFVNGLGTRRRVNLLLGLPGDTPPAETIKTVRARLRRPIAPTTVAHGPVKRNALRGADINLFDIPVPKWHPGDGGRYINTFCAFVTRDPDTGEHNVGIYRGMIVDRNRIVSLVIPRKDWYAVYEKYRARGERMPVAFVYGCEPTLLLVAGSPLNGPEYELAGALGEAPLELVKCETSDILVPANAEMVIEGSLSLDPETFAIEGPFGEGSSRYSEAAPRPVTEVACITYRDDPIYQGAMVGTGPGVNNEVGTSIGMMMAVALWEALESAGIPGVLDVVLGPIVAVRIHKTYQGQARQVAAALWAAKVGVGWCKVVMVVDEDVDVRDPVALFSAMQSNVLIDRDIVVYPLQLGSPLDVSMPAHLRDELRYGASLGSAMLIDATTDFELHPARPEWGGQRTSPRCHASRPDTIERVSSRWTEFGL